jgi:hypothetical protein
MAGDIGVATLANGSPEIPQAGFGKPDRQPSETLTAAIEDEAPPSSRSGNTSRVANVFDVIKKTPEISAESPRAFASVWVW